MLPEEEVTALGENVGELFRCVSGNNVLVTRCGVQVLYFIFNFIVNCETCGLQAGGWSQTEDCWEIDSNREVCSKEGSAILFF